MLALALSLLGFPLDSPAITFLAAGIMLLGGIPHGAFDIALATRAFRLGPASAAMFIAAYIAIAGTMAALWAINPIVALAMFLAMSALHFGEDWKMLDEGLLRAMAGAAIIAVAAISNQQAVGELFSLLAGSPDGIILVRIAVALAPVAVLVTSIGLILAWRTHHRAWAAAQLLALCCLASLAPVLGFAIYFTLLHSPQHMAAVKGALKDWSRLRIVIYGGTITAISLAPFILVETGLESADADLFASHAFRLLSILAAPHLVLSLAIERHLRHS